MMLEQTEAKQRKILRQHQKEKQTAPECPSELTQESYARKRGMQEMRKRYNKPPNRLHTQPDAQVSKVEQEEKNQEQGTAVTLKGDVKNDPQNECYSYSNMDGDENIFRRRNTGAGWVRQNRISD